MTILNPEECIVFFGKEHPCSNWHEAGFQYQGTGFRTVEHFMMFYKARLFKDFESAEKILRTRSPYKAKRLGRRVKNYDDELWSQWDEFIVGKGKVLQALQNPIILAFFSMHHDKTFIEASPTDIKWGVGLSTEDPRIYDTRNWYGQNRLGNVLGAVAQYLFSNFKGNEQ